MPVLSRRMPWLLSLALIFIFLTLCVNFGLRSGGSLFSIAERSALAMTYPIQKGIDIVFTTGSNFFDSYINLVGAKERNRKLKHDNDLLKYRLAQLQETQIENERLHKLLNFKKQHDSLKQGIAAHVIGRQTSPLSHILIVDCGANQKLSLNNPVFTLGGVVGRVISCGPQSAKVLLLIDRNSACDAIIQRNRIHGILQGTGTNLCRLAYLQRTADVKVGDKLITSGLDGIFPKGIIVGTVITAAEDRNGLSQQIQVQPMFDPDTIEEVYIIPAPPAPAPVTSPQPTTELQSKNE
jgi:rod shape-determining protein MreC